MGVGNTVIIGGQFGDEGKGKVVDAEVEASNPDVVVRFNGGHNAGHTVKINAVEYKLHVVPSGIFHEETICVVGNGTVVEPVSLCVEIDDLQRNAIMVEPSNLRISDRAHLILPYHAVLDQSNDKGNHGEKKVGTTGRGIGPAYASKANRDNPRFCDALRPDFPEVLRERLVEYNALLVHLKQEPLQIDEAIARTVEAVERLRPYVTNTQALLHKAYQEKKRILFEGAQGMLLDIDHGTYPFVTSSTATIGGVLTGTGLPSQVLFDAEIIGVMKAYVTRVGEGPFLTQMAPDLDEHIRTVGEELGTTTGRNRKCGWFNLPEAKYAQAINGFTSLAITKLDVLADLPEVLVCVGFTTPDGRETTEIPADARAYTTYTPIFRSFPGWGTLEHCVTLQDLPKTTRAYLDFLASELVPISRVSIGKERSRYIRPGK